MSSTRTTTRGYSLLMVLMLMGLLGVAVGGLLGVILRGARTSGSMLDRRTTFYACDGMGRQLASLGQAYLARNTVDDVSESDMQRELRLALPGITPAGFEVDPRDLVIPEKPLPEPAPIEMITTGPFAGLEVKLQVIDMRFQARRSVSGAVCRSEQSLSLGRIALFQFFVFADLPLLDLVGDNDETMLMRGRIHTNGRTCLGGGANAGFASGVSGPFAVRLDVNMTAVDRIVHSERCNLGGGDVGIVGNRARGPAPLPPRPDRLLDVDVLERFSPRSDSGCSNSGSCPGGWRSFTLTRYLGRLQDTEHEVQELTLPVDPPEMRSQRGWPARGAPVSQVMRSGPSRPNTRFLVEPQLTNDPAGFARNKLAHKAQLRIIDGVWYVKDPGADNSPDAEGDDGPWPGIPIWSDHPGEFTVALTRGEGVEGGVPIEVGQSDIRAALDESADVRLEKAKWSARRRIGASPTPRRFSYYAFVDHVQAASAEGGPDQGQLSPKGQGLQFGRVLDGGSGFDVDPPAVISYGGLAPVQLAGAFSASAGPPTEGDNTYWLPGLRLTDGRIVGANRVSYAPRDRDEAGYCGRNPALTLSSDDVRNSVLVPAVPQPIETFGESGLRANGFPSPRQPLPADGTAVPLAPGSEAWSAGRLCASDNELQFRRRMRLALLDATRTGFVDTNNHRDTRMNDAASPNVLPLNFNLHAFQEALADKTPGELGSYFCDDCLWPEFNGSVYITNTWRGSMLGAAVFPDGNAEPPPNPVLRDHDQRVSSGEAQPHIPIERRSTTGPLPYTLCAAPSDEAATAHAQVVGRRFVEADEIDVDTGNANASSFVMPYQDGSPAFGNTLMREMAAVPAATPAEAPSSYPAPRTNQGSFRIPECERYALSGGVWSAVRPTAVRVINGRTLNFNRSSCGDDGSRRCLPELSTIATSHARSAVRQLDNGLNVVTNVPMYIAGDINQTSEVNDVDTGRRATNWIPVMFAADTVTTLSNGWDDEHSRWEVSTNDNDLNVESFRERPARTTRYTMLLLTGLVGAGTYAGDSRSISLTNTSGGGLHNAMRLMEDWRGERHIFRGAMVLGWMPVYTQWRVGRTGERSFEPPALRNWQFDRHLNATVNQPPDSPVFDVTALRSWRRE